MDPSRRVRGGVGDDCPPVSAHRRLLRRPDRSCLKRTRHHCLLDIVTIALYAVICGAENWVAITAWGAVKLDWLRSWLELPNGIPSHDTSGRVFGLLALAQVDVGFLHWAQEVAAARGAVVAVDGQTVRGSGNPTAVPLYPVSTGPSTTRLVLGQEAVGDQLSITG